MINFTKKSLRKITGSIKMPNLSRLFPGEFGVGIGGAFKTIMTRPSFFNHIIRVVSFCTKKKMIGINAMANIASMKNAKSLWNWASKKLPGYTRADSHKGFSVFVGSDIRISMRILRGLPKPTSFCFLDFAKKALTNNLFFFHGISIKRSSQNAILFGQRQAV